MVDVGFGNPRHLHNFPYAHQFLMLVMVVLLLPNVVHKLSFKVVGEYVVLNRRQGQSRTDG